jgi:hypothetical protein
MEVEIPNLWDFFIHGYSYFSMDIVGGIRKEPRTPLSNASTKWASAKQGNYAFAFINLLYRFCIGSQYVTSVFPYQLQWFPNILEFSITTEIPRFIHFGTVKSRSLHQTAHVLLDWSLAL